MQIGCHVSISGSIDKSVDNAVARECSAFQIFTRNPRGWNAKGLSEDAVKKFKEKLNESKINRYATCAHMPYLPNLSTPKKDGFEKSVTTLINEVERCGKLGLPYLVTHLGSHLGSGEEAGMNQLVKGLNKAAQTKSDTIILLENTAGQKNSVGANFEQLAEIFNKLTPKKKFGICLDTCHAFVSGYDLRTEKKVLETFKNFNEAIGLEHLKILHLNDAKGEKGCNLDRHYHIGLGNIGEEGLSKVIKIANKKNIPIILETPIDNIRDDFANLKKAKELM